MGIRVRPPCYTEHMDTAPPAGLRYAHPSALRSTPAGPELSLATCSPGTTGTACSPAGDHTTLEHPFFFSGFVEHPEIVAAALLVVARTARSRFYVPQSTVAAAIRAADPVVTSTPEGLRFESFSVCCSTYCRLDIDAAALDASHRADGVTNVDVNPPLRKALARIRGADPLHLTVGEDALTVTTMDADTVEEKVDLPPRWIRGMAEVQALASQMRHRWTLPSNGIRRFLTCLPGTTSTTSLTWAAPLGRTVRLASRPVGDAVCVAGPERLRLLEPLVRYAKALHAWDTGSADARSTTDTTPRASSWVLDLPGGRLTLTLSPEKSRGFSGEGALLTDLASPHAVADAALVSAVLAYDPRIDPARLVADTGLDPARVTAALSVLAASGQTGFDVTVGAWFHRPLPLPMAGLTELDAMNPRLGKARTLLEKGAVTGRDGSFTVRGSGTDHRVTLGAVPDGHTCTCTWFLKHHGTRGPCAHVLAALMVTDTTTVSTADATTKDADR